MVKMIEDHWDTRQEYIKQGNELAALELKQEKEKKEKEKALKEMEEKMSATAYQVNNSASSASGELRPIFVPTKQDTTSTNNMPTSGNDSFSKNNSRPVESQASLGMNQGKQNFRNQTLNQGMQNSFSQNRSPFLGNNRNF